jgi:hypothetical protein
VKKRQGYFPLSSCHNYNIRLLEARKGSLKENSALVSRAEVEVADLVVDALHFGTGSFESSLWSHTRSESGISILKSRFLRLELTSSEAPLCAHALLE